MNDLPTLSRPNVAVTFVAAALAGLIGIGVLGLVTGMFQRDGTPFEQLVAAERACVGHVYDSERKACIAAYVAQARRPAVASR